MTISHHSHPIGCMCLACAQFGGLLSTRIDADGSGSIQKQEPPDSLQHALQTDGLRFVRPLSRWIHESKTAPRFSKYNLERSLLQQACSCRNFISIPYLWL